MGANSDIRIEGASIPADATVRSYRAFEALSCPFEVDIDFMTADESFEVDSCLGKSVLVHVVSPEEGGKRYFHGVVDQAEFVAIAAHAFHFRVHLVPALSALAHREDCRIFQDKTTMDVVKQIFDEAGFASDVEWKLTGSYLPREFIVQFRESTLNFVSRLLEDEGVFYYFRHSASGHKMVVADSEKGFHLEEGTHEAHLSIAKGSKAGALALLRFERTRSIRTTNVLLRDYDFEKPQLKPESAQAKPDGRASVYYEYPAGFTKSADGGRRATARMRELRREADVVRGESYAIGMRIGAPFATEGMAEGCAQGKFVVTSLRTYGYFRGQDDGRRDRDIDELPGYKNEFTAIPAGAPYAPPRRARKPRIRGVQTALVCGPAATQDQTIHCDEYGRIKVHFFWDRLGKTDDKATCWMRTTQAMMGGTMILPRVGWEVSIAFLEGDPDRPFILGRVYNAQDMPPYGLPGAKASGSVKSLSSPGGAGHNEFKMSDSGGSQGHGFSAQKDLNSTIGNNKTEKIAVDEKHNVKVNMTASIGANEKVSVGANQAVTVGAVQSHKIGGNQSVSVGAIDTTNVMSNLIEHVGGARSYKISALSFTMQNGIEHTISANLSRNVGAIHLNASVGSISDNILGNLDEQAGAVKVILAKGNVGEQVAGSKNQTATAAEVHLIKGSYQASCDSSVTRMIGGLHQWKVSGDIVIKGANVTIVGATGTLAAGGSTLKLGGGPVVLQGSTVTTEAPMITKMGGTTKLAG